jgi:alkaline phosphatase D
MSWRTDWGRLASFYLVDGRQHRTPQACPRSGRGGANQVRGADCRELFDAERTMLGAAQERWLADGLRRTADRWNVVGEATLIAPAGVGEGDDRIYWTDAWDGYPAARDRLLDAVTAAGADSTLMVSGDAHTNFVADLRRGSEIVSTEFCGTSITSQGRPQSQTDEIRASNPHIHLADSQKRGYVVFDVEPTQVRARLRVVGDVRDRATGAETLATFTVAAGRPGAHRAQLSGALGAHAVHAAAGVRLALELGDVVESESGGEVRHHRGLLGRRVGTARLSRAPPTSRSHRR